VVKLLKSLLLAVADLSPEGVPSHPDVLFVAAAVLLQKSVDFKLAGAVSANL